VYTNGKPDPKNEHRDTQKRVPTGVQKGNFLPMLGTSKKEEENTNPWSIPGKLVRKKSKRYSRRKITKKLPIWKEC